MSSVRLALVGLATVVCGNLFGQPFAPPNVVESAEKRTKFHYENRN
jgi:hypothetical protein